MTPTMTTRMIDASLPRTLREVTIDGDVANTNYAQIGLLAHSDLATIRARASYARSKHLSKLFAGLAHDLGTLIRRAGVAFKAWRHRRATAAALRALDDRLLADIGLDRSMITQVSAQMMAGDTGIDARPAYPAAWVMPANAPMPAPSNSQGSHRAA